MTGVRYRQAQQHLPPAINQQQHYNMIPDLCISALSCCPKHKYYSVAATAQWFLEGQRWYGAKGFQKAVASFAPSDLDVVSRSVIICGICYHHTLRVFFLNRRVYEDNPQSVPVASISIPHAQMGALFRVVDCLSSAYQAKSESATA